MAAMKNIVTEVEERVMLGEDFDQIIQAMPHVSTALLRQAYDLVMSEPVYGDFEPDFDCDLEHDVRP